MNWYNFVLNNFAMCNSIGIEHFRAKPRDNCETEAQIVVC